jgi:hypothetical protein
LVHASARSRFGAESDYLHGAKLSHGKGKTNQHDNQNGGAQNERRIEPPASGNADDAGMLEDEIRRFK